MKEYLITITDIYGVKHSYNQKVGRYAKIEDLLDKLSMQDDVAFISFKHLD